MADEQIRIGLAVVSDAGTQKTLNDLAAVRKRIEALKAEFKAGSKDADAFSKEFADLEKQAKKLDKALDEVGEKRRINIDTGDLENKRSGSEGLRTLGRDIRNLPSVQVPGLGIGTDTFGRAGEVLGRLGVSASQLGIAGAIAAPFVIALGVAVGKLQEDIQKSINAIKAASGTVIDVNKFLITATTSETQARITELQNERQGIINGINDIKEARDKLVAASGTSEAVQKLSPKYQELTNQMNTNAAEALRLDLEMRKLNEGIEDGTTAVNDRAEAEKKAAADRTQGILTEAAQAGQLAELKSRAADLTQEQIDSELEALDRRKAGLEAELASLESSGDTSEAVAKKIAELKQALGLLGEQADVLNNARKTAKSSEAEKAKEKAQKEAEREAERQAKEAQKRIEDTAKAQQNYNDKLADARVKFRDTIKDIGVSLKDNLADNLRKLDDDLRESTISFNEDQLKEEREYQRDLSSLKREAERAEKDAVRSRDFAALAEARQSAADAISERQQTEDIANQEDLIAFQQHRAELARARQDADRDSRIDADRAARDARVQRERAFRDAATDRDRTLRDINSMEQNFQRQSLNGWQQYFGQLLNMQQNATGRQAAGTIGQATPGERRIAAGSNFNQLQLVVG